MFQHSGRFGRAGHANNEAKRYEALVPAGCISFERGTQVLTAAGEPLGIHSSYSCSCRTPTLSGSRARCGHVPQTALPGDPSVLPCSSEAPRYWSSMSASSSDGRQACASVHCNTARPVLLCRPTLRSSCPLGPVFCFIALILTVLPEVHPAHICPAPESPPTSSGAERAEAPQCQTERERDRYITSPGGCGVECAAPVLFPCMKRHCPEVLVEHTLITEAGICLMRLWRLCCRGACEAAHAIVQRGRRMPLSKLTIANIELWCSHRSTTR